MEAAAGAARSACTSFISRSTTDRAVNSSPKSPFLEDRTRRSIASSSSWAQKRLAGVDSLTPCTVRQPFSVQTPRAVLYEPPSFLEDAAGIQEIPEVLDYGTGHGVLYDTPQSGMPGPFGAHATPEGVNFAISSTGATAVSLCLFTQEDLDKVS